MIDVREYIPQVTVVAGEHKLEADGFPYTLSLRRREFADDKDRKSFVRAVERMVRASPEYKVWGMYLRDVLGKYVCAVTREVNSETTVEIHHHPVSLFDIVSAVTCRFLEGDRDFCAFDVATDVIEMHYTNHVGYVSLVASLHEKFHNGCLDLPMEMVSGDYRYFIDTHLRYLDEEDAERIRSRLHVNRDTCTWKGKYTWERPVTDTG